MTAKKKKGRPNGRFNGGRTDYVGAHLTPETKAWLAAEAARMKASESRLVADALEELRAVGPGWMEALRALPKEAA